MPPHTVAPTEYDLRLLRTGTSLFTIQQRGGPASYYINGKESAVRWTEYPRIATSFSNNEALHMMLIIRRLTGTGRIYTSANHPAAEWPTDPVDRLEVAYFDGDHFGVMDPPIGNRNVTYYYNFNRGGWAPYSVDVGIRVYDRRIALAAADALNFPWLFEPPTKTPSSTPSLTPTAPVTAKLGEISAALMKVADTLRQTAETLTKS